MTSLSPPLGDFGVARFNKILEPAIDLCRVGLKPGPITSKLLFYLTRAGIDPTTVYWKIYMVFVDVFSCIEYPNAVCTQLRLSLKSSILKGCLDGIPNY